MAAKRIAEPFALPIRRAGKRNTRSSARQPLRHPSILSYPELPARRTDDLRPLLHSVSSPLASLSSLSAAAPVLCKHSPLGWPAGNVGSLDRLGSPAGVRGSKPYSPDSARTRPPAAASRHPLISSLPSLLQRQRRHSVGLLIAHAILPEVPQILKRSLYAHGGGARVLGGQ